MVNFPIAPSSESAAKSRITPVGEMETSEDSFFAKLKYAPP